MTKYGDLIEDHEWTDHGPAEDEGNRTSVKHHEIDVIRVVDPDADMGYGREKYTAMVRYDDGGAFVLYVVEHRWKGNYWRDVTDWDWRDVPESVRTAIAAALPVDSPDDLDGGVRLVDEGGESRWEKHHSKRIKELDGEQIWATSFLHDALDDAETAAESCEEGGEHRDRIESLVGEIRDTIAAIDPEDQEATP